MKTPPESLPVAGSPPLLQEENQDDAYRRQQLANLGQMLLEMAHELNNPLTAISMASQLLELSLKQLGKLPETDTQQARDVIKRMNTELGKIKDATMRAARLRDDLLNYHRPNPLNMKPYRLDKLVAKALERFKGQPIFKTMTIHQAFAPQPPSILCDINKMEQIFYNLVKNTHEATEGKGTVWFRDFYDADGYCGIEVEDNGPGIPEALMDRIFSPFLTTKPRTGNGLGLSISKQIIEQHGGRFWVYNKPNSGACFRIGFPLQHQSGAGPDLSRQNETQ